ncbi:hypothetical protein INQ41_05795 [Lysobacter ciconiae]|uniref:DUF5666 domain-containing protein n=1 Tax=Novilysobacter ciconiae TaxID=2781022 RepID=A0A7S6ZT39_9GAMM|nr:DUF5666 domain-containing protein [Lysobacter ciconiae]QOW20525.1 hypothetical protein INQ41_05795 [Lysobacter ciconiae]
MKQQIRTIAMLLAAGMLMLLAGCVTPGAYGSQGGYGNQGGYGVPGGYESPAPGYPSQYPAQYGSQLLGTVDSVDPRYGRLSVVIDDPRTGRRQRTDLRYDRNTRLFYQGRQHPVDGLERGDVIRIETAPSGRELWARSIEVVRNVRDSGYGGGYGDDPYGVGQGNDLRGSVNYVDTRARLIRLDGVGYGNNQQVSYDARTTVEYQGRGYRPENLQRGDQVRIQARRVGNNQWLAERIVVERSVGRW